MTPIRAAVVGLGLGKYHAAAFDQAKTVREVVLCDPDPERLKMIEASLGKVSAVYKSMEEMLQAVQLDAVSIVTPDHLHRQQAEAAFEAGCHVLLTKPIATNLEDARAIVRKSESQGLKLMVAQERRFRSQTQRIKHILESGELGQVIHLRVDAFSSKYEQFRKSPWYSSAQAGRTAIVGTGIHEVDLVRYLTGQRITSVFAFGNRLGDLEFPGDKTVAAVFQLDSGAIAQVTVSYESRPGVDGEGFVLLGTKGMIEGDRVVREGNDKPEELPKDDQPMVTGTYGCVSRFLQSIVDDTPVPISGRDAFASLAACVAADESCQKAVPVTPASDCFE